MATGKLITDSDEERNPSLIDNTINLRSRQVERNETDPACRTHIGPWGLRSSSESRVTGTDGSRAASEEKGGDIQYSLEDACKLTQGRDIVIVKNIAENVHARRVNHVRVI